MNTATGTLENIALQLTELNGNLTKLLTSGDAIAAPAKSQPKKQAAPAPTPEPEVTTESAEEETAPAPAKKPAAKRAASKTTAKKTAKAKADDLSNMVIFKKALFDAAEKSGVDEVMPQLKTYLKAQGYAASDEIEVDDREEFVKGVAAHFAELAEAAEDEDELDLDAL